MHSPANGLNKKTALHVEADFLLSPTATIPTYDLRMRWGGIGGTSVWNTLSTPSAITRGGQIVNIIATAAPGASVGVHFGLVSCYDSGSSGGLFCALGGGDTSTVATNASEDFVYTVKFGTATSGNYLALEGLTCTIRNIP